METNIYFIRLENPTALIVALPIGDINYYEPFILEKLQYSKELIVEIEKSKFFEQFQLKELPKGVTDMFNWKHEFAERAIYFYKEIVQTKNLTI
jgi:hypothetical protein